MIMHKHLLVAFLFATLASSRTYVTWVGSDGCASTPCADGESDCDNDGECVGNLICWQRNSGETDPRYDTSGINPDADVCVQPEETSTPQEPEFPSTNDNSGTPTDCVNEQIVVATYNILYRNCGGYHDYCKCANSSPARYAANDIRPDILGTQENGCQVDFGDDMGSLFEVVPYDCQSCNHNAIYYNTDNVQFAGERGVENTVYRDSYSLRMYTWARMQTKNGFSFWVFNVHNPHEHGNPRGFQGQIAEQMINKWKEVSNGEPAVFTGDFNPHKDSDRWEEYAVDHGLTKVGQSTGGICGFCDQIYFSDGDFEVVSTQVHGSGGSDHNAYSAVLRPKCGSSNGGSDNNDGSNDNGNSTPVTPPTTPVDNPTCGGSIPSQCKPHIDWAASTGKDSSPHYYPNFQQVTGANLGDANHRDITLYFYCQEVQKADCSGLLSPCCGGQACACDGSNRPNEDPATPTGPKRIVYVGRDACTSVSPCQDAQSDCDSDADCVGALICWQRDNGETREGYDASDIRTNADVCVRPDNSSPPTPTDNGTPSNPEPAPEGVIDSMSDEFSGSFVDTSKWEIQHFDASWKNQEKQCYVPGNVKLENGKLVLTSTERLFWDSQCGGQQYFSGSIQGKEYFLHGAMEVRAKLPSGDGLWPAIWLLGNTHQTRWPGCGEIDLMEVANKNPMGSKATLHYGSSWSINKHFGNTPKLPLKEDFHTWKIIRTPDVLVMLFDGVEFGRYTRDQLQGTSSNWETMFDAPMKLILNIAVGGQFTGIGNRTPNMATWDKPTMEIDYVRTWDDATVPELPCLQTVACAGSVCASCKGRIQWLMDNQGQNYDQAKTQVANEFQNECTCDASQNEFEMQPASAPLNLDAATSPAEQQTNTPDEKTNAIAIVIIICGGLLVVIMAVVYMMSVRSKKELEEANMEDVEKPKEAADCEIVVEKPLESSM